MYPVAVIGDSVTARAALVACQRMGFDELTWDTRTQPTVLPATTLSANLTKVLYALGLGPKLEELCYQPDREQVRFAASGYLLTELPLGKFAADRYGTRHINIEHDALLALLQPNPSQLELMTTTAAEQSSKQALEQNHSLLLDCTSTSREEAHPTHELWHSSAPFEPDLAKANMTWLGNTQTCWQFATPSAMHYVFATPVDMPLQKDSWHRSLQQPLETAERVHQFNASDTDVREFWYEGHVAYLGDACYAGNFYARETQHLGLEDAWVLSRMMENYEEDIGDGLREYQKYRRPRVRKIATKNVASAQQHFLAKPLQRTRRNISLAFGTRFMPEIAMQKIDWLYGYDCIRGFR